MLKTKGASRAQKFGFAPYLRPKGGPSGRSAQVERTLSHEQYCLMRTKEHSAPGKTPLVKAGSNKDVHKIMPHINQTK